MKKYLLLLLFICGSAVVFGQTRDKTVNIVVNIGTGESLEGQPVTLQHSDYGLTYSGVKLDAEGKCTVKVYAGPHQVSVSREGYQTAETEFNIDATNDGLTVTLDLVEKVRTPYALQARVEHDAVTGNNEIQMEWNTEPPVFFDDFEDYEPFAIQFGEWTGIDADGLAAAALLGNYPNRCVFQYAQIINPLTVEPTWWYDYPILRPYSGKQYVGFTRTESGGANDDWLISPVVTPGTENMLMFKAKAADQYYERFQVYVTTKIDNPVQGDFVRLDAGNYETADLKGWKTYQYDLSAYAGQQVKFAIRYISDYNRYGSFMLMVDDVFVGQANAYEKAIAMTKARRAHRSEANPYEMFHIFLDGEEKGVTDAYNYTLTRVLPGAHTLGVKAVYQAAESELVTTEVNIDAAGFAPVQFNVSTNSVISADGEVLHLVNTTTSEAYHLTVADGKVSLASLPLGDYVVNVEEGAFNEYQQTIRVTGEQSFDILLTDRMLTPYNITADVTVEGDMGTAVLRWNQELIFSDSFEDYPDFATGSFGDWTTYDFDQLPVYPIGLGSTSNIVSFPGSGTATNPTPIAPMVFNPWNTNPPMLPTDLAIMAPTGDKTIIFFSPQRGTADKWLISPLLDIREGYTLRATLKSYDAMYPESVEFLISDGSADPNDFSVISTVESVPAQEWNIFETDLAPFAGNQVRLAVRYTSYDAFILQLDDFTVGPGEGEAPFVDYGNVIRYEIYLDGVKVGESTTPTYTFESLTPGQHVVGIKAIYKNGESEMGEYVIDVVSGIATVRLDTMTTDGEVYNLSGQKLGTRLSDLPAGIYLVKSGNEYKKVQKR
ncbi:MAG: choice-of-anchor J domain-containing protein [Prevotella sp.]|nr:choice-of-anchor J domain-containing protein [Prevotella sp.]